MTSKKKAVTDVDAVEKQTILTAIWQSFAQLKVTYIASLKLASFWSGKNKAGGKNPLASNAPTQFAQTGFSLRDGRLFPSLGTSNASAGWKASEYTELLLLGADAAWSAEDRLKDAVDASVYKAFLTRIQIIAFTALANVPDGELLPALEEIAGDKETASVMLTWIRANATFITAISEASETVTASKAVKLSYAQIMALGKGK